MFEDFANLSAVGQEAVVLLAGLKRIAWRETSSGEQSQTRLTLFFRKGFWG